MKRSSRLHGNDGNGVGRELPESRNRRFDEVERGGGYFPGRVENDVCERGG